MSMAVTDPHTFETSTFEACSACGVLYTVEDGPACDCEMTNNHSSSEQCHV